MENEIKEQLTQKEYEKYIEQWKDEHKEEVDSCKCKKVFLECLPRKNTINIDWMNSVGYKVFFIYGDVEGIVEIINVFSKKYVKGDFRTFINILYNNKTYEIMTNKFKICQLGRLLNKRTPNFKIKIGQTFKDDKRDITIIDREYREYKSGYKRKWYKYHCNKCDAELWMNEYSLLNNSVCMCCREITLVKGINDIATMHPELVKYFVNIDDTYKYTCKSNEEVMCKCPNCNYNKKKKIKLLYEHGFDCPQCSDNISYPEKVMFNFLQQLKENNFICQYTKKHSKWCDKYKYDFYFKLDNEQYIVETHGEQHYRENYGKWGKLKNQQENDKNKYNLAIKNGIKPQNYIVIDCRYSELEFIKNNILHSRLSEIFDLDNVDWIKIGQDSEKSLVKEVCNYWHIHNNINNEELFTTDLAKIFNRNSQYIIKCLKHGNLLGWCHYDSKEERSKSGKIRVKFLDNKKPIEIFKNNVSLGIFESCNELSRQSEKLFGIKFNAGGISEVTMGKRKKHKGYTFKYVTKEEYYNYIDKINKEPI